MKGKCAECGKEIENVKDTKQAGRCCDCGAVMCSECTSRFDICNDCWLDSDYDD